MLCLQGRGRGSSEMHVFDYEGGREGGREGGKEGMVV